MSDPFLFMFGAAGILGPAALICAHHTHREMCARRGLKPQGFPYLLAALPPLIFIAAIIIASRIEARRAATTQIGAVHESLAAEGGDAQKEGE
jgi:hypothetical protein